MFDILVYLFENFFRPAGQPDEGRLARELAKAGFGEADIARAFDWFQALSQLEDLHLPAGAASRCYAPEELQRLDAASRGLIAFLEASGLLTAAEREWVIDRLCALDEPEIGIEQVKWIVLMVLWSEGRDYVLVEDFLTGSPQGPLH
ncbi:MAG: DUF494 domain-containing protein [Burkholderiales bacterium]|nr:DUF494 domain-containing protein [Burkholderiales bacterium]